MTDRTCPTCNYKFAFPSRLKNHLQIATHCKKTNEEIDLFFSNITNTDTNIATNNNIIYKCLNCNNTYINKYTLKKHQTISKCATQPNLISNSQPPTTPQQPTTLPLTTANINNLINNNTTNNNNNNINITNNNLTINNIIQHIYPFGFEKLPNISKEEMKKLLLSGDKGVVEIIKLVYEQEENKNFYKINMKNNNISYLNDKYKLGICQENEMKATLYRNCISLPNDMLVICKDLLTTDEILYINSNNKSISEKIKEEIYDNGLKNIINTQLIYNSKTTKKNLDKYINSLSLNPMIKQDAINNIEDVMNIAENTRQEFTPYLSLMQINKKLGDPILSPELTNTVTHNDFCMKKFEDTKYKKYWDKRKKDETKIVMSLTTKTLGDIIELDNRLNKIENKMNKMEYIHKDITFNNDLDKVEVASDYVITNRKQKKIEHDIANMNDLRHFIELENN
jgi:hypothetical protein